MKVCENCKKTFDDATIFCPECGESLIAQNKCPRCESPIDKDDLFCPQCGYNLKEGNLCPKCKKEVPTGAKFCPKCGEPLKDNQIIQKKLENKYRQTNFKYILNYILIGVFVLCCLLSIIGIFGDIFVAASEKYSITIGIKYFFGERTKELKNIADFNSQSDYYFLSSFFYFIYACSYFVAIIGILVTIGIGIYKIIYSLKLNALFSTNMFVLLMAFCLPYLSLTRFLFFSTSATIDKAGFGWGTSLLLISTILSCLSCITGNIAFSKLTTKNILAKSFSSFAFFLMLFVSVFGVSPQIHINSVDYLFTSNIGIYSYVSSYLSSGTYSYPNSNSLSALALFSFLLALAIIPLAIVTFARLSSTKKPGVVFGIVMSPIILMLSLLSGVFLKSEIVDIYAYSDSYNIALGGGVILTIIFSILSLGSLITSLSISKE